MLCQIQQKNRRKTDDQKKDDNDCGLITEVEQGKRIWRSSIEKLRGEISQFISNACALLAETRKDVQGQERMHFLGEISDLALVYRGCSTLALRSSTLEGFLESIGVLPKFVSAGNARCQVQDCFAMLSAGSRFEMDLMG